MPLPDPSSSSAPPCAKVLFLIVLFFFHIPLFATRKERRFLLFVVFLIVAAPTHSAHLFASIFSFVQHYVLHRWNFYHLSFYHQRQTLRRYINLFVFYILVLLAPSCMLGLVEELFGDIPPIDFLF
jgi:hypothetical protein